MAIGAMVALSAVSAQQKKKAAERSSADRERQGERAIGEQERAREFVKERTDPFRDIGLTAGASIMQDLGIAIPESLQEYAPKTQTRDTSLFDFLRDRGSSAIEESAAAQGRLRSGGTLQDLSEFNTNVAAQVQNQKFNQLFNLLGLGSNATSAQSTATLSTAGNIGNIAQGIGESRAAGHSQRADAISGGAESISGALGYGSGGYSGMLQGFMGGSSYPSSSYNTTGRAPIREAAPTYIRGAP